MANQRAKLTKRVVDAAEPEAARYKVHDTEIPGFHLRVEASGKKVFYLRYRVGGGRTSPPREFKIGDLGVVTPDQARRRANELALLVSQGRDPAGERQEQRSAPRMADLFDRFLSDHAERHKKASSVKVDRDLLKLYLRPALDKRKVVELTRADVDRFHKSMADKPVCANRSLALLSKALNLAEVWGWRPDHSNPCRHVQRFKERARKRYLSNQELDRLGAALLDAEHGHIRIHKPAATTPKPPVRISPYAVAAIRLLLLTGARRGEILGLRWENVNLDAKRLELPDSKTGEKFVYLPEPAVELLRRLERVEGNPYVIVGGKPGQPLANLKDPWEAIRRAADIQDVRIHDLRHSFASVAAASGMSLPLIGALLGHSEAATTQRYAHLADDPLRIAANAIGKQIAAAMPEDPFDD